MLRSLTSLVSGLAVNGQTEIVPHDHLRLVVRLYRRVVYTSLASRNTVYPFMTPHVYGRPDLSLLERHSIH